MLKKLLPLKPDPIMGLVQKFNMDPRRNKLNLTIGELYYNKNNKKHLFDYQFILNEINHNSLKFFYKNINKSSKYLPITGCEKFINNSERFVFGDNQNRFGVQTLSGTGSLTIGNHIIDLLEKEIYIPSSSWPNHFNIFKNHKKFQNILELENIPNNSVVLFHTCCNNPTGIDYNKTEWKYITDVLKNKNHIVFFDSAYLGLASGDYDKDAKPIRNIEKNNIQYIVSTSYAKNFGLYGQRIGSLFYNFYDDEYNSVMKQHITKFIRSTYSNPPRAGAEMATHLMENTYLMREWKKLLNNIIEQQIYVRKILDDELGWNTFKKNGLFFMAPLTKEQIIKLRELYGIYMLENGRINISGLDKNNIEYFVCKVKNVCNNKI